MDYYASHTRTVANSIDLAANLEDKPHFPDEGLCIGSLNLPNVQLPALINLFTSKGLCFLYDSDNNRRAVNNCLDSPTYEDCKTRTILFIPNNELPTKESGRAELILDASILHYTTNTDYDVLDRGKTYSFYIVSD